MVTEIKSNTIEAKPNAELKNICKDLLQANKNYIQSQRIIT